MKQPSAQKLSGIVAAAITPFQADGRLDLARIPSMVEQLLKRSVEGFFVCGSTGEFSSLTLDERKQVATAYHQAVGGRVPVIVHVGSNSLRDACDLAAHAEHIGASAVSAVPPHYFPMQGIEPVLRCMEEMASATSLPFYYYHIPGVTGVNLDVASLLEQGSSIRTLAGAKFSATDLCDFMAANLVQPDRYSLFFGTDQMFLGALAMGSQGFVGSTYNFASPLYTHIRQCFRDGNYEQAYTLQTQVTHVVRTVLRYRGLAAVKAMTEFIGCPCGPVRTPLHPLSDDEKRQLKSDIEKLGFFS